LLRAHGPLLERAEGRLKLHYQIGAIHKFLSLMTITNSTASESDHTSGGEITVWVGVPGITRGLPSSGRLLVVEAEPERAQELRNVLRERPDALVCEEVLAANNEEMVQWNRFNDARLSGPSGLSLLQERFPNLHQIDEEQRRGRRLGDLLDNWGTGQGEQALAQLHLVLRQGDPLGALVGLGPWLSQLKTVQFLLPWPEETMRLVETWLAEHGFRQDPQASTMWKLDPIAKGVLLLKEKENEKQALLTANQQLNKACETMKVENSLLEERLDEITRQLQEFIEAQNLAQIDIQNSQDEAEKLRNQQETLQQVNQQLTNEKSELLQRLQAEQSTSLNCRQALKGFLPLQLYKERNTNLIDFEEDELILHYLQHGRDQSIAKSYQELESELESSRQQCEEAEVKLKLLESQFELLNQQLETLKDLFARLADRQRPQQQGEQG